MERTADKKKMLDEDKIPTGGKDGEIPTPTPTDIYANLRGQKDESGIPLHPEERADYYKTKFAESTRGVESLRDENKKLKEQQEFNNKNKEQYTEDELSRAIPDWDILTIEQKRAMVNSMGTLKRDLETIKAQVAEIVDEREFEKIFKKVTSEPEFEIIKKHKADFKIYAYQDENLNVPLPILAKSFLVDKRLIGNYAPEIPKDPNPDAGLKGMDVGAGGDRKPPVNGGYTVEEIEKIRTEDPKKYNRLAREKKLTLRD
jgi:hypothetical protein